MDSHSFFEYGHPYINFIDSELEKEIKKISENKEVSVILSSGSSLVSGWYSTEQPEIPTTSPQIKLRGKTYWAENIAKIMRETQNNDFYAITLLQQLYPYALVSSSKPTSSGFSFCMLVAGDIPDEKKRMLIFSLEKAWKEKVGYSLNLT